MTYYDVIVIGGGAAGLMAAGQAANLGARTLILEKMDQPGRKLFITGKFRCNLTNMAPISEFISHYGKNGQFLRQAFHQFFSIELIDFFHNLSVPTIVERGGRVFPESGQSKDVVNALVDWCQSLNVEIGTFSPVEQLLINNNQIKGLATAKEQFECDSTILACGGASYPGTGSTGDGYLLARSAGHSIISPRPALVPLITAGNTAQRLQGLSLRNVNVCVISNRQKISSAFGEMIFTHFGVSGPIILTLSKQVVALLDDGQEVTLSIDLKPALDISKLNQRILRDFDVSGKKHYQTYLKDLLPKKLIHTCVCQTKIPGDKPCHQISSEERNKIVHWLKNFQLKITGHRGFRHAIVTSGGINTKEINPRTMGSLRIKGLFFAGEVIDIDADTGGYNLQAAFSTGWLAGRSAAHKRG